MRYGQLLSELRALEALALYYENLVLYKARELDEYLAQVMGTMLDPLTDPVQALPPAPEPVQPTAPRPVDPPECVTLDEHKKRIIANCLSKHHGNVRQAAKELKISRNFFYRRAYGINGDHCAAS
jgi:transcriptional regulator of acetoin/glycerol metabolism